MNKKIKPKIKTIKIYPKVRIYATGKFKQDYIDLEFKEKGIYITTCTDNCGNVFFVPYELLGN